MERKEKHMNEIIDDLIKIYLSCVDSYIPKCNQVINDKYTVIDKCLLSTYLYIMIIENRKIEDEMALQVLSNYLMKQVIYSEVGNIQIQSESIEPEKMNLYNEVMEKVIVDRFQYMNRIMKKIKYQYIPLGQNDYSQLILFLEEISDYAIYKKLKENGSKGATEAYFKKCQKIKSLANNILQNDVFIKEKTELIELIAIDNFEESQYGKLINVAMNLKDVNRFSLINSRVNENVLFHQFIAAIISLCLGRYCNQNLGEKLNIYKLITASLFHDFGEYKGTEITAHIKNYNDATTKMFEEIEEIDENELREKVGDNLYKHIIDIKNDGPESYVCGFIDKMLPYIKTWIEIKYYNNYTYIKLIPALYRKKFQPLSKIKNIDEIKEKSFFLDLLIEYYIFFKNASIESNFEILSRYFTDVEISDFKNEIKLLRDDPKSFWN